MTSDCLFSKEIETRYYGECHHIFGNGDIKRDDCIKRYIVINDIYSVRSYRIAICNEYARMKINENLLNMKRKFLYHSERMEAVDLFINDVILDSIPNIMLATFEDRSSELRGKLYDNITYEICHRPRIYGKINFHDAMNIYMEPRDNCYLDTFIILQNIIRTYCIRIIDTTLEYAKFKKYHDQAGRLKKSISMGFQLESVQNELINFVTGVMGNPKVI